MSDELKDKIKFLELKVASIIEKVNELVLCLEDNELYRKVGVDVIYDEDNKKEE